MKKENTIIISFFFCSKSRKTQNRKKYNNFFDTSRSNSAKSIFEHGGPRSDTSVASNDGWDAIGSEFLESYEHSREVKNMDTRKVSYQTEKQEERVMKKIDMQNQKNNRRDF